MSIARNLMPCTSVSAYTRSQLAQTHRPVSVRSFGRNMDSEIGVGRNWSADSAASCLNVELNAFESFHVVSVSM